MSMEDYVPPPPLPQLIGELGSRTAGWTLTNGDDPLVKLGILPPVYTTPTGEQKIVQVGPDGKTVIAPYFGFEGTTSAPAGTPIDYFDQNGDFSHTGQTKKIGSLGGDLAMFAALAGGLAVGMPALMGAEAAGAGAAAAAAAPWEAGFVGTEALTGAGAAGAAAGAGAAGAGAAGAGGGLSGLFSGGSLSSLAGPAASLAGGLMGSNAAGDAADAQLQAAREAMGLQEPFRQGGMAGMNRLLELLGLSGNTGAEGFGSAARDFSMADFQADPGFQFRQEEGERGLQRAAAANGSFGSGRFLKDAMRFNQGLASQEFGNAFNRFQVNRANKLQPLQSLMGAGQTAANTIGDITLQGGNAQAAGTVGKANAWGNALGGAVNSFQQNELMNLLKRNGSMYAA